MNILLFVYDIVSDKTIKDCKKKKNYYVYDRKILHYSLSILFYTINFKSYNINIKR